MRVAPPSLDLASRPLGPALAYMAVGLNATTMSCFNAVGHPLLATKLSALFSLLLLPFSAYTGSALWGLPGMFGGAATAGMITAWFGTRWMAYAGLTPS